VWWENSVGRSFPTKAPARPVDWGEMQVARP
jgi:hypothetical protein